MKKTYKLELEVTLDEVDEQKAMQVARGRYLATGCAKAPLDDNGQIWREISAEEGVADAIDAIMELVGSDALCEQAGIEVVSMSCDEPKLGESSPEGSETNGEMQQDQNTEMDAADDTSLDEVETGMYLCRWPNGDEPRESKTLVCGKKWCEPPNVRGAASWHLQMVGSTRWWMHHRSSTRWLTER